MDRRKLFRMFLGIPLLPSLFRKRPINMHPELITPLYMMQIGDQIVIANSAMYGILSRADQELKACTGIKDERPVLNMNRTLEIFKQRIIDEQRQS